MTAPLKATKKTKTKAELPLFPSPDEFKGTETLAMAEVGWSTMF
jgi:hypothetical protein